MSERKTKLSPELQARLDLQEALKVPYISTWRDAAMDAQLEQLALDLNTRLNPKLDVREGNWEEACALAVVGDSGAGKTRLVDRALNRNRLILGCPLEAVMIRIGMPAPATLAAWGLEMADALGFPMAANTPEKVVWKEVRRRLPLKGVRLVRIDEFQNVTKSADRHQLKAIRASLKGLMVDPDHPVALVVSGLPDFLPHVAVEQEVVKRMRVVDLLPLHLPEDWSVLEEAFAALSKVAGIVVTKATEREVAPRLLHAAFHQMGEAIKLMRNAFALARQLGASELSIEHFAADYLSRRASASAANPFLAKDWRLVDVRRLAVRKVDDQEPPTARKEG